MRWKGWSHSEVMEVISSPINGNSRYLGCIRGHLVRAVLAADDPDVVITVHPRGHL
jgi:hypothetical protein